MCNCEQSRTAARGIVAPAKQSALNLTDTPRPEEVLSVAYGSEIAQLEQALRAARSSDQHPANPIVEWQTIGHSNALDLR